MCCNMQCTACMYKDCIYNGVTDAERKQQDAYDTEVIGGRKYGRGLVVWKYEHTDKGKARAKRYEQSDKGKERQKRYAQSEKGKAVAKKKQQKKIESGKNAEYCRRYYQRKKAEREAQHESM